MNQGKRKWPEIDIIKLYAGKFIGFEDDTVYDFDSATWDATKSANMFKAHTKWNMWLTRCLENNDLNELIKVRYGLQAGMDDLVKKKLSTPQVVEMFLRWISSIERTARQIIKKKNPLPNDSSLLKKDMTSETLRIKRSRDLEFDKFLTKSAF